VTDAGKKGKNDKNRESHPTQSFTKGSTIINLPAFEEGQRGKICL
jgi:hypothetical protein